MYTSCNVVFNFCEVKTHQFIFSSHPCQNYSGTRSYIDGTKDWKTMKKRLRFQMPHVPLKVLRGQQDEEDIQDQYHERFQAPGTTTEDDKNDKDDDNSRSSLSNEDITTDMGEDSDQSMERYLGLHTDSVNGANPFGNDFNEGGQNSRDDLNNTLEYGTMENVSNERVQVFAGIHHLPNTDVTSNDSVDLSNDETAPLLPNVH